MSDTISNADKIDVLFLGSFYPLEIKNELYANTKGVLQFGGDVYQNAILKGLSYHENINLTVMTSIGIGSFPFRYKKLYIRNYVYRQESYDVYNIGFVNLTFYKILSRYISVKKFIKEWIERKQYNKKVIIVSSLDFSLLKAACEMRSCNNIKICLIITDLVKYMTAPSSFFYPILMPFFEKINMRLVANVDYLVLISEYIMEKIGVEKKYVVIEGVYDITDDNQPVSKTGDASFVIMYSGTLAKKYGIMHLLNAFNLINNDKYQLWIFGEGDAKHDIQNAMKSNKNIKYFGQIERKLVLEFQKQATLLINPRHSIDEYTIYSFPSKTMEYMASGRPVLMHKLKGIPDNYYDYIYFCIDESDIGLKNKIIELCNKPPKELDEFGAKARKFIIENKNSFIQADKIIRMFNENEK